ncbi:MAG: alpha/beta hydrolase fold domain-containing protein, partial [Moraxellaceae bacterium]|nr:alpha/beta hydrolase fold domain-containing protein [Moraxellaceae bacterium]
PWTDLTLSGESLSTKARADHMLTLSWIHAKTPLYRGKTDASHPLLSPLFADLSGLPPTLVQTGSEEILLSDSERLAERAAEIGWDLQLTVWQGLWHDFQLLGDLLPEADDAIAAMARFVALRAR